MPHQAPQLSSPLAPLAALPLIAIVMEGAPMPRSKNTFTPQDANLRRVTEAFSRLKAAGRDDRDIWSAFVTMAAAPMALAAGCAPSSLVEDARRQFARYEGFVGEFDEMLSAVVDALEGNPDRDVMGYVYNALGFPISSRSQFFTPYDISKMIAQMMLADSAQAKKKGYISICDPCAGSGGMLVAAFNVIRDQGMNPQTDAWFEAQDISQDTALMCYVQMSLLGMAGRVIVGDSLAGTRSMELLTIGAVAHPVWAARRLPS
ncbi:MAG: N-6 DNA methylase [Gordonibacter urolithinfaciens]